MTASELVTLSVPDTARVAATVVAPMLARGIIVRRPRTTALVDRLEADRRAGGTLTDLRERYGPGPVRLRIPGRDLALVLAVDDVDRLLADTDVFTPANREKITALRHFQPPGLLISDADGRRVRRPFNEAVLDHRAGLHRLHDRIVTVTDQEIGLLRDARTLEWEEFRAVFWRIVRRVVLGDAARDDTGISELVDQLRGQANWAFLHPRSRRRMRALAESLRSYVDAASVTSGADADATHREDVATGAGRTAATPPDTDADAAHPADADSLAGIVARTPAEPGTAPVGQIPHWLFAFDAAALTTYRSLALLAADDETCARVRGEEPAEHRGLRPVARATVLESVRLWPTTLAILRDSTTPTTWRGRTAPAGTGFVVVSTFFHRDPRRLGWADRFTPEAWLDGRARADRGLVPFSAGPATCPGRTLVLDLTSEVLAAFVRRAELGLQGGDDLMGGGPLPRTLAPARVRLTLAPRVGVGATER